MRKFFLLWFTYWVRFLFERSSCAFIVIFIHLFFTTPLYSQNYEIKFKNISTNEGLSQSNVTAILEDSQGIMWFGTRGGLNKYDGYKFITYSNELKDKNSISSNSIRDIIEDKNGNIWVATLDEGLNLYDRKTDKFVRYKNDPQNPASISSNSVDKLYEDKQGSLWIGTILGGLNKFDSKNNSFIHYIHNNDINSISDNNVYDIFEDSNGNLWIGTEKGGLNLFDREKGTFTHYKHDPKNVNSISQDFVRAIYEDKSGNLWLGTYGQGLNRFNRNTKTFTRYKHDARQNSLSYDVVMCLSSDDEGNIWIGTENGGLSVFDIRNETFSTYIHEDNNSASLSNNSIYSIYKDRKGNIWIGTYNGGINFYDRYRKKFNHYRAISGNSNSLNNNSILSFAEDQDGKIWIGTDGGGLNLFDRKKGTFTHHISNPNDKNSLSGNYVVSVIIDKRNNLWAATWMDGLTKFDRKANIFTHFKHSPKDPNSLNYDGLWHLMEDRKGNIWVGSIGGGLELLDENKNGFTHYTHDPDNKNSLGYNNIHYFFEDSKGYLWVGTDVAGVDLFDRNENKFIHFKHNPLDSGSLSNNIVNSISEDSKGNVWICTNAGINKYNRDKGNFKVYLEKESVKGLLEDDHRNFWICSNNGVHRFNPDSGILKSFYVADGLQANEFNYKAFLKTRDGYMLMGGPNGFNIFHPDSIKENPNIPPVIITGFNIFNKPVPIGEENSPLEEHISFAKEITLSYKQSVFSFEFAALNYSQKEKNQYAFKMEGFDKDWHYVGTARTATYTNLDAGNYIFKVKASNNDGIWNEEGARLKIIITPPFWKTWWFNLLAITSIVAAAFSWYTVRVRNIEAKKAELEQQVQLRTSELQKANTELFYQKEEILSQKEEIQAQAEKMQVKNEELSEKQIEISRYTHRLDALYLDLKDSIRAAESIQKSILSPEGVIKNYLPESFILNKPKDVVSGDFYWFNEMDNQLVIAVADCTGHGVSGAFMSINGYHLLKDAIREAGILSASEILNSLNQGVIDQLNFFGINEGMDIGLCILDKERKKIQYAGAKNPLYILRESEFIQIKGDIFSIGMKVKNKIPKFKNHQMDLQKGDTIYLFTDGYADQIGGGENESEKIMYNRFRQLISSIQNESLESQRQSLIQFFDHWKKGLEQLDDVLVIGFRI